ncbi:MAG: ribonuclease Y [Calditrichaeota bacterium]|nr:ribonuclease Y [Calditrichota bacterium]MCB9366329.1 ribonuclease Y [Calditrichota bacterium]
MDNILLVVSLAAGSGIAAFLIGWFLSRSITKERIAASQQEADRIIADAQKEAETMYKEKMLEMRDEQLRQRTSLENEIREIKDELSRQERSLKDKDANLRNVRDETERKRKEVDRLIGQTSQKEKKLSEMETQLDEALKQAQSELERAAGLSKDDALEQLKESLLGEARNATADLVKNMRDEAKATANREAREVIVSAIQRSAADHSVESTVSVVHIPNDEIKGRIIGREGRNIRAFEQATGVDIIVDDTPETVVISGFDPYRREIARLALEQLMADGRIHPQRIEELVKKIEKEMDEKLMQIGDAACLEAGVTGLHRELIKLVGRLKYRTSYGQNILHHSIEVAHLSALMCAQLGFDAKMGRRAGLLHDIGKAIDRYTEGTHVEIGIEIAKKYREPKIVINTIAAHHNDTEFISPIGVLVQAADAISGARPGARRETLELYVKRLQQLEEIASGFKGVQKTFAIQAGREIRIIVEPQKVSDALAEALATDIAKKVEEELEYPGQIKVTVLREFVATGVAK